METEEEDGKSGDALKGSSAETRIGFPTSEEGARQVVAKLEEQFARANPGKPVPRRLIFEFVQETRMRIGMVTLAANGDADLGVKGGKLAMQHREREARA